VSNDRYDVFVSYSRADARQAADIDSVLRQNGLQTFFDRHNLAPGLPWVRDVEEAIGAAKAVVVLLGPSGLGNTQQYERELAFVRQTGDPGFPVVPVLLPQTTVDPPFNFLRVATWVDFSRVVRISDAPDQLQRLLAAVLGGRAVGDARRDGICPYRGLDAFREEDSAFFFGRGNPDEPASPVGELVRKAREHPFVMVVGRSGSGKSSLVYAGLVPALRRDRDRFWNVLSLRPGPEPLRALAAAFNPRAAEGTAAYATKIGDEADKLRNGDPELLSHMVRDVLERSEGRPDHLLLYIDQWEELYAQTSARANGQHGIDVRRFVDLLLNAARSAPVTVVATVRADFYDPLISHQEIRSLLPNQQVLLGSMPRSDLERTIVEPARMVGLTFDPPSLVERILDDAGEDEGMLPLLQYALKETWAQREGRLLTGDSYARSGGVREAIRITAERTFDALSAADQQAARQLFLRLVTPGEGQEDTRARAAMPLELVQRKIIEQFAGPRTRLLVTGFDRARRPTVEVAHEALIRTWPRLRKWIDVNREKLRARSAVLQAKTEWEQQGRREDLLLPSGFQLERARALLKDPGDITIDDVEEFITLSSEREEKERREKELARRRTLVRTRVFAIVAVVLLAVVGVSASSFFQQRKEAEKAENVAITSSNELMLKADEYLQSGAVLTRAVKELLVISNSALEKLKQIKVTSELRNQQIGFLLTISDVYVHLGDTASALRLAQQAEGLLADAPTDNEKSQLLLWGSHFRVGDALVEKENNDEAQKEYSLALDIAERFAFQAKQNPDWLFNLLFAHAKVGDLLRSRNDLQEALKHYRAALSIAEQLTANDPSNLDWRHQQSATHNRIGQILADQNDLDGALEQYRIALTISEDVAQQEKAKLGRKLTLTVRHSRIAAILKRKKDFCGALKELQIAKQIGEELTSNDSSNALYSDYLAQSYIDIGGVMMKMKGRLDDAIESYRKGEKIRKQLAEKDHDNLDWKKKLANATKELQGALAEKEKGASKSLEAGATNLTTEPTQGQMCVG
jgi:tetratricopeptide (TPR) repeat protein